MKLNEEIGKQARVPKSSFVLGVLVFLGIFSPLTALAATAHLKENAPKFIDKTQSRYGEMVHIAALLHGVDQKLILAVIIAESEGNANVVSRRGAQGLMQLMPTTAKAMGAKDPKEPLQNILAGTKYLKELTERYGFDSPEEILVAYNRGPSGAKQWLLRNSPEDYGYVKNVMYVYRMLDAKEQTDMGLAQYALKRLADQDMLSDLRPLVNRPRSISLANFPMTIPTVRKIEVESGN